MLVFILILTNLGSIPAVSLDVRNLALTSPCRNLTEATVPHGRFKRKLQCQLYQWQCKDGTCIAVDGKCDGKIDCPDKSDETHALCRSSRCQRNWFRCTYGACVDGTAYCNGVVECADQSDELSPECRNDRSLSNGKFRCVDGHKISAVDYCNGIPDCFDGSDETVRACASQSCASHLFQCAYGACVDQGSDCNGHKDCADGSDEAAELCHNTLPTNTTISVRTHTGKFRCEDGHEISVVDLCDGIANCPDGSDETERACADKSCPSHLFRCAYGACVDGGSDCNGEMDCVDGSDETAELCHNLLNLFRGLAPPSTTRPVVHKSTTRNFQQKPLSPSKRKFKCVDGYEINVTDLCDGITNCPDGSDETGRACAGKTCASHLFRCAYGACVDGGSDCNGHNDCADGSDEAAELCHKTPPPLITPHETPPPRIITTTTTRKPVPSALCVLPPYPEHGRYVVPNGPFATPGQGFQSVMLNITCDQGYNVVGDAVVFCQGGIWSVETIPNCVRFCKLEKHVSVRYYCRSDSYRGHFRRICNKYEPSGTRVSPECNFNYFYDDTRPLMKCYDDGTWNYIAKCKPDCGRLTPSSVSLIGGDDARPALRGELPWHVSIYRKPTELKKMYTLICGGSLVTNSLVISAAHCFWDKTRNQQADASTYEVAVAKLFSAWNHTDDADAQKSEISCIKVPELYSDSLANYQEDIALVILKSPFVYHNYVRPVCLDFGREFNDQQLQEGSIGKVAGFGLVDEDGRTSEILRVVDLPFVSNRRCKEITPLNFRENITGDKICAGFNNGSAALCRGDSGGGLSFPADVRGATRFYLRGVASTAPKNNQQCNLFTVVTFTHIRKHEDFIKENL